MFLCLALGKDQGVGHSECFRAPCSLSKFSFKPILPQSPSTDPEPAGSGIVQGEENRTPTRSWNRPIAIIPVQEAEIPTVCLLVSLIFSFWFRTLSSESLFSPSPGYLTPIFFTRFELWFQCQRASALVRRGPGTQQEPDDTKVYSDPAAILDPHPDLGTLLLEYLGFSEVLGRN